MIYHWKSPPHAILQPSLLENKVVEKGAPSWWLEFSLKQRSNLPTTHSKKEKNQEPTKS